MADDVLHSGVRGVTDLMVMPGLINLDFADIRTVMSEMGKAMMGTGEAEGERRAIDAAEAAISNPLLEDVSMKGARGVLINITGGTDMTLFEVDEAANRIREEVDPEANIIFGSTFDEKLAGQDAHLGRRDRHRGRGARRRRPAPALAARAGDRRPRLRDTGTGLYPADPDAERGGARPARRDPQRAGAPRRGPRHRREPVLPAGRARPRARRCAAARSSRRGRSMPAPARPAPIAQPAVPPAAARRAAHAATGRVPSLIERVTGVGPRPAGRPRPPQRRDAAAAARRTPTQRRRARRSRASAPLGAGRQRPGAEQGRRSARHPGLPAPPGELTRRSSSSGRIAQAATKARVRPGRPQPGSPGGTICPGRRASGACNAADTALALRRTGVMQQSATKSDLSKSAAPLGCRRESVHFESVESHDGGHGDCVAADAEDRDRLPRHRAAFSGHAGRMTLRPAAADTGIVFRRHRRRRRHPRDWEQHGRIARFAPCCPTAKASPSARSST